MSDEVTLVLTVEEAETVRSVMGKCFSDNFEGAFKSIFEALREVNFDMSQPSRSTDYTAPEKYPDV